MTSTGSDSPEREGPAVTGTLLLATDLSTAERVDMIIVGSHGRGGVGRALIGSVSDHVVRHAPCPVLVVRRDVDDPRTAVD